jgi:integrase
VGPPNNQPLTKSKSKWLFNLQTICKQIISNQKFNKYVKDVCKIAELNEIIEKGITKAGKRVIEKFKKWELFSSHTARRSFATNLCLLGVSERTVREMTGHESAKAFNAYIRIKPEQHAEILEKFYEKQRQNH